MPIFTDDTFQEFLGKPLTNKHDWGDEWRFAVTKQTLEKYSGILRDTLYQHHTFFDLHAEIEELGFVLSSQAMKDRYSGNPSDHNTQMGNLGEVLGAQLARTHLGFCGDPVYPKRYNTNPEQSQKGIDILGFKDANSPAELLIGEVKVRKDFIQKAVHDDYETLCRHQNNGDIFKKLHFARAYFRDSKASFENIERHKRTGTPIQHILLSITEDNPRQPFNKISEYKERYEVIKNFLAIHIEIEGLTESLAILFPRANHV